MWVDDRHNITGGVYGASPYDFGKRCPGGRKSSKVENWYQCREEFHKVSGRIKRFYFCHGLPKPSRGRAVSEFIDRVEARLGLRPRHRSRCGSTSKRKVMWVQPSHWWRKQSMRRSLFLALLRHGCHYRIELDNFTRSLYGPHDEALYRGTNYLKGTQEALDRFLGGYTCYWGGHTGWVQAFDRTNWLYEGWGNPDLEKVLRKRRRPRMRRTVPDPGQNVPALSI